jgi:hypothetical protein
MCLESGPDQTHPHSPPSYYVVFNAIDGLNYVVLEKSTA